jgi:hypothetical protein
MTDEQHGDAVTETADLDHPDARPREPYPNPTQQRIDEESGDADYGEGRHSETDEPHEEQPAGSLEEPETEPGPHEGEEGQREEVA